ncbi:GAF domain-containing protein [Leptothoe sp. PORK10 BA2]|uniref:GAF domain-containing protein n=1 Tax=Leptothoe sp. PORK10 BA2 TaxID=3110254 RepID=UPI002B1F7993|nr:GAF domain-containing protein [Leptothoe sp. PORK10 BA2]MEA5467002.1 GAF domain-containing protein [Leptothoe sp. PORK10 BA2]
MVAITQSFEAFEQQYKTLFDHSNDGIILHDPMGQILDINLKALNLFGYSQAEATQLTVQQLHPQAVLQACKAAFQTVMEKGETSFETLFCRRDGTQFPAEVSAQRLQIDGQPFIQGIIRDITERKTAESVLQQQLKKERLISEIAAKVHESLDLHACLQTTVNEVQTFLDTDRVVIYQFNPDWSGFVPVEAVNEHCDSVLQQTIHDPCFGEGYLDLYQRGRIGQVDDIYEANYKSCHIKFLEELQVRAILCVPILRSQKLWGLMIAHHCRGPRHWTELEADLLGQLATQVAIATQQAEIYHQMQAELMQRQQVESALRQSEVATRSLYEIIATPAATFCETLERLLHLGCQQFDLDLGILSKTVDTTSTIVASYSESGISLKGMQFPLSQTYCQETLQSETQIPFSILSASQSFWKDHPGYTKFKVETYLGMPVWVAGSPYGTLYFSSQTSRGAEFSNGEIEFLRLITQWIRGALEREQAAQELARTRDDVLAATRAKSEFLATISHEIRTPMNAIIGMTSVLLDTSLTAEQQGFIETIRQGSESLLSIINNILDFSKVESGQLKLEEQPFDLRNCISDICDFLTPSATQKQLSLSIQIAADVPPVIVGDVTHIRQILVNLIGNAIKFTSHGHVCMTVTSESVQDACEIQFAVQDTGIGIPAEKQQELFKPFSQLDGSTARKYGGTGLGLVICQQLVQVMNGRIWFESEVNQGSTFYFTVAAQPVEREMSRVIERSSNHLSTAIDHHLAERLPLRILLAEDNHVNQNLAIQLLGRMGYRIDVAGNGLEVLKALERQDYDVILMDIQMPEMDGIMATQKIHEIWDDNSPRIIAMTANAMAGDRENFLEAGMDDYISKPIHIGELVNVLETSFSEVTKTAAMIEKNVSDEVGPDATNAVDDAVEQPIYLDKGILEQTLAPLGGLTPENLKPFLDVYVSESPELLKTLKLAMDNQDVEQVQYASHTLKSSSAALGLVAVQKLCQTIENESRVGNITLENDVSKLEIALNEGMRLLQLL